MDRDAFLNMAHISGEIWGTLSRAYAVPASGVQAKILGYDAYFEIFERLRSTYKEEVTADETETPDGEDD